MEPKTKATNLIVRCVLAKDGIPTVIAIKFYRNDEFLGNGTRWFFAEADTGLSKNYWAVE